MKNYNNSINYYLKSSLSIIPILALFLILGAFFLKYYQYDLISKDIISIISVAKLYADGDINGAINGYWGPLFSWLLIPFIKFNSSPYFVLYSMKILSLVTGIFTIIGVRLLSYRFEMDEKIRYLILFSMIFIILYFSLRSNPVDLLLTCFVVYYLYFIFSPEYRLNSHYGFICGLLGAAAYLTKSYALTFFIAHFLLFNLFYYFKEQKYKKIILKNLTFGLAIFLIISGSWSVIISDKYEMLTFGTSGAYNHDAIGPRSVGQHPTEYINQGFIKPPHEGVTSAWYDPTYFNTDSWSWSPFESVEFFKFQLRKIVKNILTLLHIYTLFSYLSLIIIVLYLLLCFKPFNNVINSKEIIYPLFTVLLFPLGYLFIALELRYLWLIYILLMLMGGYILNLILKYNISKIAKAVFSLFFIISFLILPINTLLPINTPANCHNGKDFYQWSQIIENNYHLKGNIASNGNADNGNYKRTLHLSYFLGTAYYGFPKKDISNKELENELIKYNIDYYFVWGKSNNEALLSKYNEITDGEIQGLRIYSIKNK
ncbi:hypothetical protein [Methanobacterium oryzae]|uniref:hypothetical protein n=1 Tax=Methanobacterium oryzae TaxID=69540 RepID=UPI003D1BE8F4